MAWDWSHTDEAYGNALENVASKSIDWLHVVYAEWHACSVNQFGNVDGNAFCFDKYTDALKQAKSLERDTLVEHIWDKMSAMRTCDNGGWNAWACPSGCHTVPFDLDTPANE